MTAYEHLSAYGRAAFFIRWWPAFVEKIKLSARGDRWRLPYHWLQIDHTKMELIRDPRIDGPKPTLSTKDTTKAVQTQIDLDKRQG
jgi:hypothetical protein